MTELVRCLALFPNLHTLQLFSGTGRVVDLVRTAFDGKLFPSVHTVNVNFLLFSILPSFPEVRHVSVIGSSVRPVNPLFVGTMIFEKGLEKCPKLEVLRGLEDVDYKAYPLIHSQFYCFVHSKC